MAGLKDTRNGLFATLTAALAGMPSVDVFPTDTPALVPPAVTVATFAITPTTYRLRIRVYVVVAQDTEQADLLDDIVDAVEAAFPDTAPRTAWTWTYDDLRGEFFMETIVDLPREDF